MVLSYILAYYTYDYNCLKSLSNRPEAVLKQQKPCINHGIHVLFEHGRHLMSLENSQDEPRFVCMTLHGKTLWPGMSILSMLLLTPTLLAEMTSWMFDFASRRHFVQRGSTYEIQLF